MIRRLLIANRGEIAVRIIRACRELGVETVAIYSDADARALHVKLADRAVAVGPAAAASSYLAVARIIDAARGADADAVHPGYGFLAENPGFAAACADAGLCFVGPSPELIEQMGSKIAARALATSAGLHVVPGEAPGTQDDAAIREAARRVGYPLLVKASAGGGGKGMRTVRDARQLGEALAAARHEAQAAFGDATLYLERLLEHPRHVEFQVFGDRHGGAVHLFERDCSIQRRHQKIIEESPSPALDDGLRRRMGEAAVALVQRIGYVNAGTIEFLVDGNGPGARFYFLEMNTRLQVEHPVTEMVTGVDLVHAQLRVASGEPLPWSAGQLAQRGHVIECRVYAEDPANGFLPQAGRLALYREPVGPGIRVDSGVVEGDEIGIDYDPMIAKLVVCGETREAARRRALEALKRYPILGTRTNVPFLVRVLEHERFREGTLDTGFLDGEGRALAESSPGPGLPAALAVAAAAEERSSEVPAGSTGASAALDPWDTLAGWRASDERALGRE
jgi:acetyl-CoA carboxylase biotin carboxylase subunit